MDVGNDAMQYGSDDLSRYEASHTGHDDDLWGLHLVLAGDVHDAPQIRELLALAPDRAYGQVFLELGTGRETPPPAPDPGDWVLPHAMSLTVLRRPAGARRARRGQLLAAAVSAWVAEWLPDDVCGCAGPFALWVGCAASPDVERLCSSLGDRLDVTPAHLHRPEA